MNLYREMGGYTCLNIKFNYYICNKGNLKKTIMKKLLLLLLITPLLFSCGDDKDDTQKTKDGQITFKFNSNTAPSGTNNLIGVQIYKGSTPYAYGLFDATSKIKIDLPKDGKFTIKSSIVVDGKTKLLKDADGYLKPFALSNGKGSALTNQFTISSSEYLEYLSGSTATLNEGTLKSTASSSKDYDTPPLDRWYGEAANYDGNSDSNPEVDMTRQVFGIRFNVTFEGSRIEPDDCMYLAVDSAPDTLFIYAKDVEHTIEAMYTFNDFSGEIPIRLGLKVYHRLPNGIERLLSSTSGETLYRNTLMMLYQTCSRTDQEDSYPYYWDAINDYYGDSGF